MDFLAAIPYLGEDPGGRKPSYGRGKSTHDAKRRETALKKGETAGLAHAQPDPEAPLGHEIDVTA